MRRYFWELAVPTDPDLESWALLEWVVDLEVNGIDAKDVSGHNVVRGGCAAASTPASRGTTHREDGSGFMLRDPYLQLFAGWLRLPLFASKRADQIDGVIYYVNEVWLRALRFRPTCGPSWSMEKPPGDASAKRTGRITSRNSRSTASLRSRLGLAGWLGGSFRLQRAD